MSPVIVSLKVIVLIYFFKLLTGRTTQCKTYKYIHLSFDSRDADDKVHLGLISDAGQISSHALTCLTNFLLFVLSRRGIEAAVCTIVVVPVVRTRA